MPALPVVPKVVQYTFKIANTDNGYVDVNRLHFSYTGTAPTSAQLASHAATVLTAFGSALAGKMHSNLTISELDCADLSSPTSGVAQVTDSIAGTLTGGPLPAGTCFLMSATITRRYRGGHPRTYLPLGDDTKLADSHTWGSIWAATVDTAWAGFITAVEGAGWTGAGTITPCNVSYYEGYTNLTKPSGKNYNVPKLRVPGPVVDAIVGYVSRLALAEIRKRVG